MWLPDANVLLYAVNSDAPNHDLARSWLDDALSGRRTVGFTWTVLLAFLRLATHPAVFPHPLSVEQATEQLRSWLRGPTAALVEPGPRQVDLLASLLSSSGVGGNLVGDAHLAAIAIEHGAELVSFDRDFARFEGLRWTMPN